MAAPVAGQGAAPAPAPGSAAKRPASNYVPPRTPDGQPDISGMWEPGFFGQPVETPYGERWKPAPGSARFGASDFGAGAATRADPSVTNPIPVTTPMIVEPSDGKVPYQPWAQKKREEIMDNQEKAENLDPRVRCLQSGIPRANMPVFYNSYQIIQRPGYVVILYEWNHMTRIIPLDGRPHLDPKVRLANGVARGKWEGNTLVVDVRNFTSDTWVIGHGAPGEGQPGRTLTSGHGVHHSDQLRVIERYTPIDKNIIHYEARIEDPKVFTQPWTVSYNAFYRGAKDHQLFEYACHEGNRDGIKMMTGVDIDPEVK
jgi:hypothetical protein